jgi:DNA (cytosine-5)-methyltransferase 1
MTIKRYVIRKIGECKGHKRIYLDMADLATCGFGPGKNYKRSVDADKKCITLSLADDGGYVVSQKEKAGKKLPIIDINSSTALEPFLGMETIRVIVQKDKIFILPIASEAKRVERLKRLSENMADGAIKTAGAAFGGGILDHAAHAGLKLSGVDSSLVFANEIDDDLLEHAVGVNEIITAQTTVVSAPMQELVQDAWAMQNMPHADLMCMGIPCSGASIAGKSKRGLAMMENHPEVGHLVASAIMLINRINPAVLVIENVTQYADTASAQILRLHLRDCGYNVQETVLKAGDFGCLENRERWFMVASTVGIPMSLENLEPKLKVVRKLSEVLEDIAPDANDWRTFDYLKTKEVRDEAKGNGFNMQVYTPESNSIGVLRKGYAKNGSTDPLLQHPTDSNLLRAFTVAEHARIKEVPEHLVAGLSKTDGHIVLGQGIAYAPVTALFKRIGESVLAWYQSKDASNVQVMPYRLNLATG